MAKFATLALAAAIPFAAWAQETLVLRDGTQFNGRITGASENSIEFRDQQGEVHRVDVDRIDTIHFDNPRQSRGAADRPGPGFNGNNPDRDNRGYDNDHRDAAFVTLPAGAEIGVRTNESIDSRDAADGRPFSAEVNRDIVNPNGKVVIPRGSEARLVVRRLGDNNLALDLQTISVNGRRYIVNTADLDERGNAREGVGANKRTGEYVGGGAVFGTLLGAIAGGGKGAAIGAVAGGAAGAGTEVLTRGERVRVPAETVLNFRLDSPVTLRPVQ